MATSILSCLVIQKLNEKPAVLNWGGGVCEGGLHAFSYFPPDAKTSRVPLVLCMQCIFAGRSSSLSLSEESTLDLLS